MVPDHLRRPAWAALLDVIICVILALVGAPWYVIVAVAFVALGPYALIWGLDGVRALRGRA